MKTTDFRKLHLAKRIYFSEDFSEDVDRIENYSLNEIVIFYMSGASCRFLRNGKVSGHGWNIIAFDIDEPLETFTDRKMKTTDSYVLKQDLVIPTGTVFGPTPIKRVYSDNCFAEAILDLGKDNTGTITISLDDGIESFLEKVVK